MRNLIKYSSRILFFTIILKPWFSFPQVLIKADNNIDAYEQVRSKGLKLEVPDCMHPQKHVTVVWDDQLKEYVFQFDSHVNLDNDRCRGFDRIRTELTVTDSLPPSYLGARDGDTFTYIWKFKLDKDFIANPSFCHIHQIKAVGGSNQGAPVITLSTRAGSPEMMQLIFTPPKGSEGILKETELSQFKGVWIEAVVTATYNVNGKFSNVLRKVSNGDTLFTYSNNNISLSRPGAYYYRPKIGIYRSLKNKSEIRDESAWFNDFCIAKGTVTCSSEENLNIAPSTPVQLTASSLSDSLVVIQWYDNSFNEDHFRIERSLNETDWSLAAVITPGWERWKPQTQILSYADSSLIRGTKYFYRVNAQNLYGTSDWSEIVGASTENSSGVNYKKELCTEFKLRSYPEPFNSSVQLEYEIPVAAPVQLVIYDSLYRAITTLVDEFQNMGKYSYSLSEDHPEIKLNRGTYFVRLRAGELARIIKLEYLKEEF